METVGKYLLMMRYNKSMDIIQSDFIDEKLRSQLEYADQFGETNGIGHENICGRLARSILALDDTISTSKSPNPQCESNIILLIHIWKGH